MRKKDKRLLYGVIATTLLMVISFILALIKKTQWFYSLYWCSVPFLIVFLMAFLNAISIRGKDSDIDKTKVIQRSFDDTTTISTFFYTIIYVAILFVDQVKGNVQNNIYIIVIFFIITMVYELCLYLSIYNMKKDTSALLNKQHSSE